MTVYSNSLGDLDHFGMTCVRVRVLIFLVLRFHIPSPCTVHQYDEKKWDGIQKFKY